MGFSHPNTSTSRRAPKKGPPTACGLARPKKPRGPKTAYNYFYEEERRHILTESDDPTKAVPPSRHHKIIGSKWRRIGKGDLLKKYQAMAEEDDKRYEKEKKAFKEETEVFDQEEEKAQKKLRKEEEKAAKLVRERIASTMQAYGEGGGGPMMPSAAQSMGLYAHGGSAVGPLASSAWGLQDGMSPASAMMPTAMTSAAGSVGWAAPGVMSGQWQQAAGHHMAAGQMAAGQMAAGQMAASQMAASQMAQLPESSRPPVSELVQRLRHQRAALEETTDALLEASNQKYAAGISNTNLASAGHGLYNNNASLKSPDATANTNLGSGQPSSFTSGPIDANAILMQQLGASGAAASRKPTYAELMAMQQHDSSNPGTASIRHHPV